MKFGFMTFSTPTLDLQSLLETARRFGYAGVEPRVDQKHGHGIEVALTPDERAAVRAAADSSGVELAALAASSKLAIPESQEAEVEATLARITLARDLGIRIVRVFGGDYTKTAEFEAARECLVSSFRRLAPAAGAAGVVLAMETHDAWTDPAVVAGVMHEVSHPNIGVTWDILHPVRTGKATLEQSYSALKPWIRHVHVHDWADGKFVPIGSGIIDHTLALGLLKSGGYEGYACGEWINWDPWEEHLPREIASMNHCLGGSGANS